MSKYKEDIIRLRKQDKSYREIENELDCSKGTIAYHCQQEGLEDIGKKRQKLSDKKKKAIRETYKDETAEKTAEIHDVSESTVKKYGKKKTKQRVEPKQIKSRKEVLQTKQHKGILAEEKVKSRLTALGYVVLEPNRKVPYDLVAEHNGKFARLQVKYGRYKNGAVKANLTRTTTNINTCKSYSYSKDEIDYFTIYNDETDEVYVVSSEINNKTSIWFRTRKTKNNQKKNVRRAKDYTLNKNTDLL